MSWPCSVRCVQPACRKDLWALAKSVEWENDISGLSKLIEPPKLELQAAPEQSRCPSWSATGGRHAVAAAGPGAAGTAAADDAASSRRRRRRVVRPWRCPWRWTPRASGCRPANGRRTSRSLAASTAPTRGRWPRRTGWTRTSSSGRSTRRAAFSRGALTASRSGLRSRRALPSSCRARRPRTAWT